MYIRAEEKKVADVELVDSLLKDKKFNRLVDDLNRLVADYFSEDPDYIKHQVVFISTLVELFESAIAVLGDNKEALHLLYQKLTEKHIFSPEADGLIGSLQEAIDALDKSKTDFTAKTHREIKNGLFVRLPNADAEIEKTKRATNEFIERKTDRIRKAWQIYREYFCPGDKDSFLEEKEIAHTAVRELYEQDNKIRDIVKLSPFVAVFHQDPQLKDLVSAMSAAVMSFDIENQDSITLLINTVSAVQERLEHHIKTIMDSRDADIKAGAAQEAFAALQIYINDSNQQLNGGDYLSHLAMLSSALVTINEFRREAITNYFAHPILKESKVSDEVIQSIDSATLASIIYGQVRELQNKIVFAAESLHSKNNQTFQTACTEYNVNKQKIAAKDPTVKVLSGNLTKALEKSSAHILKDKKTREKILNIVEAADALTAVQEIGVKTSKPQTFSELGAMAKTNHLSRRPLEEQASFKYQLAQVRYTLTEAEIKLLAKATQIDFGSSKEKDGTISYDNAINEIELKITQRTLRNNSSLFRRIFWKERTSHLQAAVEYLKFYKSKSSLTNHPELRLGAESSEPGKHRNHQDFSATKGQTFRKAFTKRVNKLSILFSSNRALKKLSVVLQQKKNQVDELKKTHTTLLTEKFYRNHNTHTSLTPEESYTSKGEKMTKPGKFFEPSKLFHAQAELSKPGVTSQFFGNVTNFSAKYLAKKRIAAQNLVVDDLISLVKQRNMGSAIEIPDVELSQSPRKKDGWFKSVNKVHSTLERVVTGSEVMSDEQFQKLGSVLARLKAEGTLLKKQADSALVEEFKDITLRQALEFTYQSMISNSHQLISKTNLFNFNPHETHALNKVGHLVREVKAAKKEVVKYADAYVKLMHVSLQANNEAKALLQNILLEIGRRENPNVIELLRQMIKAAIDRTEAYAFGPQEQEEWHPSYLVMLKNRDIQLRLREILSQIVDIKIENKDEVVKTIQSSIDQLQEDNRNLDQIRTYTEARVKSVVSAAQETSRAITHLADHTTTSLRGSL